VWGATVKIPTGGIVSRTVDRHGDDLRVTAEYDLLLVPLTLREVVKASSSVPVPQRITLRIEGRKLSVQVESEFKVATAWNCPLRRSTGSMLPAI